METYITTSASQADYQIRRKKDEKDEKTVGDFLDNVFYPTWTDSTLRNTDKETQIKGLDITVTSKEGYTFTIDEKAATRWAGKNLQTFAHEISSINKRGEEYDGWLLDFNSSSEYLVEVWVDGLKSTTLTDWQDITDATVVLIPKSALWHYLRRSGVNSTSLRELGRNLRNFGMYSDYYKGFKVTCQQTKQEMAANILIPRSTLINTLGAYAIHYKDGKTEVIRQ